MTTHIINLKPLTQHISDHNFARLCASNPELKLETDATGNLIVMSPTGSQSGKFNMTLAFQIELWNRQSKLGIVFDSSTGFKLSNGAVRAPDVSWIEISRWNSLSDKQKRGFAPIEPDFVIEFELMSPTDDLLTIQKKMAEYINCPKGYTQCDKCKP